MGKKKRKEIEIIARGVMVKDGHLLVCRNREKKNLFLPGGHVEFKESAKDALEREIIEEAGKRNRVGKFLGACEHTFNRKGRRTCEVNFVFVFNIPGAKPSKPVASVEDHIEFIWLPLKSLAESTLEPWVLRSTLQKWLKKNAKAERWGSSY